MYLLGVAMYVRLIFVTPQSSVLYDMGKMSSLSMCVRVCVYRLQRTQGGDKQQQQQ